MGDVRSVVRDMELHHVPVRIRRTLRGIMSSDDILFCGVQFCLWDLMGRVSIFCLGVIEDLSAWADMHVPVRGHEPVFPVAMNDMVEANGDVDLDNNSRWLCRGKKRGASRRGTQGGGSDLLGLRRHRILHR